MTQLPRNASSITIIVPVFNEVNYVIETLKQIEFHTKGLNVETIVVDDGSHDGTLERLMENSQLYSRLISLKSNSGKGKAVREGFAHSSGEYIVIQDADLEYSPKEIPRLMAIAYENNVDLLLTTRLNGSSLTRVHYFWHRLGNKVITFLFNIIFNTTFTDIYSGYLVIKRKHLDFQSIKSDGWGQQVELIASIITKNNPRVFETPISYQGRTYKDGKKIRATAILPTVYYIFQCRIRSLIHAKT